LPEADDDDVLNIDEPLEVRRDEGVILEEGQALPEMPDEVESQDETLDIEQAIPPAPDLDALLGTDSSEAEEAWPSADEPLADDSDWSDNWFKNLEEND
jgi:hypothetical protein